MRDIDEMVARFAGASARGRLPDDNDRLTELPAFGPNPGALRGWTHIPENLAPGAALVVVLHGCTQTAAAYDYGSGWSTLADRHGFALLFPEQQRANNPSCCFNWFSPEDSRRGHGEAESIHQMILSMIAAHSLDPGRVFVTGLSAGGAMASVMLATYPDMFAGGAIIAGLPYGAASNVPEAFQLMRGEGGPDAAGLAAAVRRASTHRGPWPTISIWHGSGDATVNPSNAAAILDQWRALHGVGSQPTRADVVNGYTRRVWCDGSGREVIEDYSITGMGHGTPLSTDGEEGCGAAGAFMLEARISSTSRIAQFWGLADGSRAVPTDRVRKETGAVPLPAPVSVRVQPAYSSEPHRAQPSGVQEIIENALRAAGLMR
jgi:poly(hydroxyalkanoate) depolymerase family esterase